MRDWLTQGVAKVAYRYADEPFTITVKGINLESCPHIHITFRQGDTVVNVVDPPVLDESHLVITLTQQQTGMFRDGTVYTQGNIWDANGKRHPTGEKTVKMERNLLDRVIVYEPEPT